MQGVRLGVDVGKARIGVAKCDPHRLLATPVETVTRDDEHHSDVQRILALAVEHNAVDIVVGLPVNLSGKHTPATADARQFAQRLADATRSAPETESLEVRLVDERLSTVTAQSQFHAVGKSTRQTRAVIDQAAAVVILQHALDSDRAQGVTTGEYLAPKATAQDATARHEKASGNL